jgi:DNA polymerase-3 subunit epsilon
MNTTQRSSTSREPSPLAFLKLQTTGLDPQRHAIVELAVLLVDPRTLGIVAEQTAYVADGVDHGAIPLTTALADAVRLLEGATVAGHHVGFDWAFFEATCKRAGIRPPRIASAFVDTAVLAAPLVLRGDVQGSSLSALAVHLGVTVPSFPTAFGQARLALECMRALAARYATGDRVQRLGDDEQEILGVLLSRLELGRRQYGPWSVHDGRDYPAEAYEEVLDGLHYCAAELVRRRHLARTRKRRVYVCHPYASDPVANVERVRAIARELADLDLMPVAPHLYIPAFVDEATERERALKLCLELVDTCDELWVFGDFVSPGMQREIAFARSRGIPVVVQSGKEAAQ